MQTSDKIEISRTVLYLMPTPNQPEIVVSGHLAWLTKKLGIEPWGQILIAILFAASLSVGAFLWTFNGRMSKVEGQLSVLVSEHFLSEAAQYAKKGEIYKAITAADKAQTALQVVTKKRIAVPSEYFEESIAALNAAAQSASNQSELTTKLYQLRVGLALYRSALEQIPTIPKELVDLQLPPGGKIITSDMLHNRAVYRFTKGVNIPPKVHIGSDGAAINGSEIPRGMDLFNPTTRSLDVNDNSVNGLIIIGASQTLDGFRWKNVIFVGARIKYLGGEIVLDNVRFVNCTFDVPESAKGAEFADYAALFPKKSVFVGSIHLSATHS
jgi:hypothetical protein